MLPKRYFLLVAAILMVAMPVLVNAQVTEAALTGTWTLAPQAGALAVGPNPNDGSWWSSSADDVTIRACLFDDEFVFGSDGTFQNVQGDETWVEGWQGADPEGCGAPVAPHDGSNAATWSVDEGASTITVNGIGAHLGLAKVFNGGELGSPGDAPESITYNAVLNDDNTMLTLTIDIGGGWWTFTFASANAASPVAGVWKMAPVAGALMVGPGPNDGSWWSSSEGDVETRSCFFDDQYVFYGDGSFQNVVGDLTWVEGWQGGGDACAAPVAPHDGSNPATYTYDEAGTITLDGVGAYLGIPKAYNGGELGAPGDAPASITYNIDLAEDNNSMTVTIDIGGGWWTFAMVRDIPEETFVLNGFEDASDIAIGEGAFWELVMESEDVANNYLNTTLISAAGIPQDGDGAVQFDYSVANDLGWGGYISIIHTEDAYLDLSENNYISFYIRNYLASSLDSTMSLRFTLLDGSNVANPEDWSKDSCEYWYSFIEADFVYDAPDTGWAEIRIPLVDSGSSSTVEYGNGFVRTGWAGQEGNGQLDIDMIAGYGFEFVGYGPDFWEAGDVTYGSLWIDNLSAFYSAEIPGCTDPLSVNYNPDATVDDGSCLYEEDIVWLTFELNMELEEVSPNGVYLAGGGTFGNPGDNPMNDDGIDGDAVAGDDMWSIRVWLPNNTSTDYTFTNGNNTNWSEKEDIAGQDCAVDPWNDRHIDLGVNDTTVSTCFAQCSDDGTCSDIETAEITLQVDMQEVVTHEAGVFIAGGGFGEEGILMEDPDGDDIWVATVTANVGSTITWKFRNSPGDGNWGGDWEDGDNLAAGGCAAGEYNDRYYDVTGDAVLEPVCFSSCFPCAAPYEIDVTFSVNMTGETGYDTPYIFGNFNDWDYFNGITMTETSTAGVFEGTVTLMSRDTVRYLFGHGVVFEDMTGEECAVYDGDLGLDVRQIVLPADGETEITLNADAFGGCGVVGIEDGNMLPTEFAVSTYPNPFNPDVTISYDIPVNEFVKIDVVNMRGQTIRSLVEDHKAPGYYEVVWNGRDAYGHSMGTGIYFVVVSRASGIDVTKVTLLK